MNLRKNSFQIDRTRKKYDKMILLVESFFAIWAMIRVGNLSAMNIIAFLFFGLCYSFFVHVKKEARLLNRETIKNHKLIAIILSVLFTMFYLSDTRKALVADLNNRLFQLVIVLSVAVGLFLLFYYGICYLMIKLHFFIIPDSQDKERLIIKLPMIGFIVCVLCRIPWLLYSYPGIMTPDSINQFEQVIGMEPFSNHHPWLHTMTIALFYNLGSVFTDTRNNAFVFFTIFQICFMAFAVAYFIWVMSKYTKNLYLLVGLIAIYALLPYHNVMAICIWKDVMFAGTLLIFCTSLFYLLKENINKENIFSMILYFVSGFLMCLYRSNGWYAFIVTFPFLLIAFRKKWKLMLPLHLVLLAIVLVVKGPVMNHYEVIQPDFVESVSIPLQQIGRVVATEQKLTSDQEELLGKIMKLEHVPELYTEYISDNMKELVRANNSEYLEEHKLEYLKLWIELGLEYPDIYLDAYIAQTRGYYSPSATYNVAEVDGIIDSETGLYREYLLRGKPIVKIREILVKLQDMIPMYGALWNMGSLFWGTLLFLGLSIAKTNTFSLKTKFSYLDFITVWMPNIAVIATLLIATPVAVEFRYAYNLAYCIPLYLAIMLVTKEDR